MTTAAKFQQISEKPMSALTREDILTCSFADMEALTQRAWDNAEEGAALISRLRELGLKNIFDRFSANQKRELAGAWDGIVIQAASQ